MEGSLRLRMADGTWEDRFFVLDVVTGDLLCLPTPFSTLREAEAVINVLEMTTIRLYPHQFNGRGFEILASENQSYLFLASSVEEVRDWIEKIRHILRKFGTEVPIEDGTVVKITQDGSSRDGTALQPEPPEISELQGPELATEAINCMCYTPDGLTIENLYRGGDYVQDVRDDILAASELQEHLATEFRLEIVGERILDTMEASYAQLCDFPVVQKAIKEKKVLELRVVFDQRLDEDEEDEFFDTHTEFKLTQDPAPEDYAKFTTPLLHRVYLHIRIIECWFSDDNGVSTKDDSNYVNVIACLYHGGQRLSKHLELSTSFVPQCRNPQWNECLTFPILLYDLPEVASVNLAVYSGQYHDHQVKSKLIGWTNYHMIDEAGRIDTTKRYLRLWKDKPFYYCGAVPENVLDDYAGVLSVSMESTAHQVNLKKDEKLVDEKEHMFSSDVHSSPTPEEKLVLSTLADTCDIFTPPTDKERLLLWKYRYSIKDNPRALLQFLQAVPWHKYIYVKEARRLLLQWRTLDPYEAIQLLGPQFGDPVVRSYAVMQFQPFSRQELKCVLLQLVQALQYEPGFESTLLDFLLERAAADRYVAQCFFWHMKASIEIAFFTEKLKFAMVQLRKRTPARFMLTLSKQEKLVTMLDSIARELRRVKGRDKRMERMLVLLSKLRTFEPVSLPLDPSYEVNSLDVEECRFMDSKKLPLWLVFRKVTASGTIHSESGLARVIFKTGDDLRQDMLALQLLGFMNKFWTEDSGLDMRMSIYGCVPTRVDSGMVEVVDAETHSCVCRMIGGVKAVFQEDTLVKWFTFRRGAGNLDPVLENFMYSCAAYAVGSCVLGIGDRHNDNIMLKESGEFFHVDFGRVLGYFKWKFGIKREYARFAFTPDMAFAIGKRYREFENVSANSFNIVRAHGHMLLSLLSMMISCGLPQVGHPKDIAYMQNMLMMKASDEDAAQAFKQWLDESLHCKATQINYALHTWVHPRYV